MENFSFCSPTEFIFGRGSQEQVGLALASRRATMVMIVYGSDRIRHTGLLDQIESSLTAAGVRFIEYGGIQPNPTAESVYNALPIARDNKVDFILAVGGGSPIDAAKAIALGTLYPGDFWDFYSGKEQPQFALPVGVVLTIPAAGSEGSGNSVITNEETHQKISVRYPNVLRPRFAIMNPELTMSLPWDQTAYGIVDMMAHIYERYFSKEKGKPSSLKQTMLVSVVLGIVIIFIVILGFSGTVKSVLDVVGRYISYFAGPALGAFLLAMFTTKANDKGVSLLCLLYCKGY